MSKYIVLLLALAGATSAVGLGDVKHVIMLMMENRSFQHYFGTMSGVRGFADPNVQINSDGKSVWYQNLTGVTTEAEWLLPYWLNYLGGAENFNKSMCLCAGANNWIPTQQALQGGVMNKWAQIDTPQAWGYFKRQDIPWHFALAESYTVADAYHAAITSNTDPNRWFWQSGTINVPGGKQALGSGGVVLDDNQANGCVATNLDCLPLQWPAYAQYLDEASVDWRSFQESYNWATNSGLFYFEAFQQAAVNSSLYERGLAFDGENGFDSFKAKAANGTLPEVSWVFPPGALQEHPPETPKDAAWFMNEIVSAAINGPNYNETIILINYDDVEAGGWGDAVQPLVSPSGTAGEWFEDPYGELGYTFSGPGIRVPLWIISPFSRGGKVFTERADHSSILQFLEEYLTAKGYSGVNTTQLSDWRRDHMSNLINAFDFENPDYSIPVLPQPDAPITNSAGQIIGMYSGFCDIEWTDACSSAQYVSGIPYGNQTEENSLVYENGFKGVRGALNEGHYLVFESNGYALSNPSDGTKQFGATAATAAHDAKAQRWVIHGVAEEGTAFNITSAVDGLYISQHSSLSVSITGAEVYDVVYIGSSLYTLQKENGDYLNIAADGSLSFDTKAVPYSVFSVTYNY
ncbi:putative hemolytic phospholipase C precursor [Hyaloscypha variabilis F]|uniref:Putative hemolytic phospholipase C n=1 Tax=Hyaloscypha variabilis (strain UAMH 11265 / GT02V1 / F) TaxID=1149755 RepID=A0A2J6R8W5_HYAVF|nr:putative hemolytic phospholipase C precursor [Hyaloscypha variabilis F]